MKLRALLLLPAVVFCAVPAPAADTIFLLRHAEKAQNDAKDPDLSEAGRRRAQMIAHALKDAGITAIFATEFKRTQQTADPLAQATQKKVVIVPAQETAALLALLQKTQGNAVVFGHSNTIPAIVKALGNFTPVTIGEQDYDDLFLVTTGAPAQLLHLHLPLPGGD